MSTSAELQTQIDDILAELNTEPMMIAADLADIPERMPVEIARYHELHKTLSELDHLLALAQYRECEGKVDYLARLRDAYASNDIPAFRSIQREISGSISYGVSCMMAQDAIMLAA